MRNSAMVLLVDDDQEIVRGASLRLLAGGYQIVTAHDGDAGVASAIRNQPSAIILDVRMPVLDGLAALSVLKSRPDTKDIPVIIVSASIGDQRCALDAGAKYFLRKPYRGESLLNAVNAAISSRQSVAVLKRSDDTMPKDSGDSAAATSFDSRTQA